MSPRVQARIGQNRLRTPRIPSLLFHFDLFDKALMKSVSLFIQGFFIARIDSRISALIEKRDFLFDQGFFIAHVSRVSDLLRIVVFKLGAFQKSAIVKSAIMKSAFLKLSFKEILPPFYICFPTSVL
ncbi:MAG: hypothetical protein R2912_04725 [Eubacteriales bacterium]